MKDTELEIKTDAEKAPIDEAQKFLDDLAAVNTGYAWALIITLLIAVGGIVCAVLYTVFLGLLLIILAVVTYVAITTNLLYAKLGIAYRSLHGCLTVTALYGKNREVVYIPDRLIWLTVTEIGTRAFTHENSKSIREIHLPKSLLRIGTSAFARLPALTDIYYEGTEKEWRELSRLAPLENVTMHFCAPIPRREKIKKAKKTKKAASSTEAAEKSEE